MRELTADELKLAPKWAVYYSLTSNGNVRFHDNSKFVLCNGTIVSRESFVSPCNFDTKLIPKKPFNISEHEFSDRDIVMATLANDYLCLHLDGKAPYVAHSKQDAIAIAKALGVTWEDLL